MPALVAREGNASGMPPSHRPSSPRRLPLVDRDYLGDHHLDAYEVDKVPLVGAYPQDIAEP